MRTFVAVVLLGFASFAWAGPFAVVEQGEARCSLVLPGAPEEDELLAARELVEYVQRMSGAELPQGGPDAEGPKLFLGRAESFPAVAKDLSLAPEEYRISAEGNDLAVLGGSARGALWGAYALLDEWGCRWYMPGPMGEHVPKQETLTVENAPRTEGPDFSYRQIWYSWGGAEGSGARLAEWARRNRLAHPWVQHGHNLTNSMPPEASFDKRPELYSLRNGRREASQVCTTDPEAVRLIIETVNRFFDEHPDCLCYSLCPDDNRDFCECERCRLLDTGEKDREGFPIVTDRLVTFVNAVAEGIQERHPGKMVSTYAYVNHSTPPKHTPVSPHVAIFFTTSMYCGGHGIGDTLCESRMAMRADLEKWSALCPNMYIYEYDPVPGNAEHIWPLFGARVREFSLYRAMGIQGLSMEAHCSWATLSPNHWFTARCLWKGDQDMVALLYDYCRGFYGPAAGPMHAFHAALENAMATYRPMLEWGTRDIPSLYPPALTSRCRSLLDEARRIAKEAGDRLVAERLSMVDMGFRYLEAYLAARRGAVYGLSYEEVKEAFKACLDSIEEMVYANVDYIEVQSCLPTIRGEQGDLMGSVYGKELGLVTEWNAIGPFDNTLNRGVDTVYPPEEGIDLEAAYKGIEGPVRWRKIAMPEYQGYVDLLHHFTPQDWVTVYALGYIHSEREVDAEIRAGSNDTLKVWLAGSLIWQYGQGRKARMDEDIIPVHIPAGVTPVLLKISQTGLDWGFFFRITDSSGESIPGIEVKTTP